MFTSPPFIWALLGLLLIGSEFLVPGFVIFFFGAGALLTALLGIIPGIGKSVGLQILIWLVSSSVMLGVFRRYLAGIFKGRLLTGNDDEAVGRRAVVIEPIGPDSPGRIRYEGTSWEAESYTESFKVGDLVEILKQDGLKMIVTRSITGDNFPDEAENETTTD